MLPEVHDLLASNKIESIMSPVQSGSNRLLQLMNRKYRAEEWKSSMIEIHRINPAIRLSTQFMVGFPLETDDDFNATLNLLDKPLVLDDLHIFRYSNRPTVKSATFSGQVPEEIKDARYAQLLKKFACRSIFRPL
jgi:tRNA A37 methylthiotransferase MiaB